MIKPKRHNGILLGLSAGLAALLTLEVEVGPFLVPEVSEKSANVKIPIAAESSPLANPPMSTFAEVVARPLFTPSRRPPQLKPKDTSIPSAAVLEPFDLIGVVLSPDARTALLRPKVRGEVLRVVEGQNISGWKVSEITSTQVILKRAGVNSDSNVLKINNIRQKYSVNPSQVPLAREKPAKDTSPPEDGPQ